jgi:hypothetical protein
MSKTKSKFREKILKSVNVPVERISFRKDKWGELATVYFGKSHRSASIGDDDYTDKELFEGFLISVKIGSRSFVAEITAHQLTDEEILQIDFYDLCGCAALWMSDEDKIKYYRECMNTDSSTDR